MFVSITGNFWHTNVHLRFALAQSIFIILFSSRCFFSSVGAARPNGYIPIGGGGVAYWYSLLLWAKILVIYFKPFNHDIYKVKWFIAHGGIFFLCTTAQWIISEIYGREWMNWAIYWYWLIWINRSLNIFFICVLVVALIFIFYFYLIFNGLNMVFQLEFTIFKCEKHVKVKILIYFF